MKLMETIFGLSHLRLGAGDTGDGRSRGRGSVLAAMAELQGKEHQDVQGTSPEEGQKREVVAHRSYLWSSSR